MNERPTNSRNLTGFGREQNRDKTTRAGFDAHLTKPADEAALAKSFAYPVTSGTRSTTRQ